MAWGSRGVELTTEILAANVGKNRYFSHSKGILKLQTFDKLIDSDVANIYGTIKK